MIAMFSPRSTCAQPSCFNYPMRGGVLCSKHDNYRWAGAILSAIAALLTLGLLVIGILGLNGCATPREWKPEVVNVNHGTGDYNGD